MKSLKNNGILSFTFFLLSLFVLSGCGYKPSSYYAKNQIYGNVFVDLKVNIEDPKNSVLIKDAMNEFLVSKLNTKLVYSKKVADILMEIKLNSVGMSALSYGTDGYIKLYKATSNINVKYTQVKTNITKSFNVSGTYDFSVDDGGVISDTKRFEAIRNASDKALEEVMSKLAIEDFRINDEQESK